MGQAARGLRENDERATERICNPQEQQGVRRLVRQVNLRSLAAALVATLLFVVLA